MKALKTAVLIILCTLSCSVLAELKPPPMSKVMLNLTEEAWVTTHSARVLATLDITRKQADMGNLHRFALNKFKEIANADWHINVFNRHKDQSGMERIHIRAEARIAEVQLANIRRKAKKASREGAFVRVSSIIFRPSLAEYETVRNQIRAKLYAQAKAELARLNSVYPDRTYRIHAIDFTGMLLPMMMRGRAANMAQMSDVYAEKARKMAMSPSSGGGNVAVSDKIVMHTHVVLSAKL